MLFNCRIVVLFAVSSALGSLRPDPYLTQTDLTSRSNSDTMLSYTYRSQPSEQQPVPRMWSTQSSTRQEGYLLHPRNVRVVIFLRLHLIFKCHQGDDNGHGPFSPQPLTDDDFERLHASNHLPPAPSTSSVFTIDPKKLELHASKSSNNGDEPQSHALPPLSPDQVCVIFFSCVSE